MPTFEDRWSLCRPSKTDDRCEIVATLAQNIDGIVVCAEGLHFSAFIIVMDNASYHVNVFRKYQLKVVRSKKSRVG